jgi:hypothetical protein
MYDRPRIHSLMIGLAIVVAPLATIHAAEVYRQDFNADVGASFPEWSSSEVTYESAATPPGSGTLPRQSVVNSESPQSGRRFLGEFGGPKIGTAADPGYNRTAVVQTIRLTLDDLPPHQTLRLSFDLLILKSWDGDSPQYGPDRLKLAVAGGPTLLDASFSNNHKLDRDGSYQDFPKSRSVPQTDARSTNSLGYDFFGDSIYHFDFDIPHDKPRLELEFTSNLFEGKGAHDESWGIDNVVIQAPSTQ